MVADNIILENDLSFLPLSNQNLPIEFDCGDNDLEEFLFKDAFHYEKNLVARTFIVDYKGEKIAYFSLAADAIPLKTKEKMRLFKAKHEDPIKQHKHFPALKIARLAVCKSYKRKGVGKIVVESVVGLALQVSQRVGLRFVSVDSYPERAKDFYPKLGFEPNKEITDKNDLVSMRRDLLVVAPGINRAQAQSKVSEKETQLTSE